MMGVGRWVLDAGSRATRMGDRGSGKPPKTPGPRSACFEARSSPRVLWIARLLIITLTLVLLGLLGRVVQLQVAPPPRIAQLKDTQRGSRPLPARRGAIVDRRGRVLAATRLARKLFIDPMLIRDPNTFASEVAHHLEMNPITIDKAMNARPDSRYVVIDPRMTQARLAQFDRADLPGLATNPYLVRDYPQGELAGPLLGFVGTEGKGLDGLELAWNKRLTGRPGQYTVLRDARRRALWLSGEGYRSPRPGRTLRLTLDATIQAIAQKQLARVIEHYHAKSGQLVVMAPYTGQILAMANAPTYDPNHYADADARARRNRAVTDVFEPGSIFKPIVWAGATQAGYADPREILDATTAGWWKPDRGPALRDAHGHGKITWAQVLIESSNIGMAKVAQRLGKQKLYDVVHRFGFGQSTGSGLPGEVPGILHPAGKWSYTSVTRIPMGQGIGVTALQMVRAFAAIANGGNLVTPRFTFNSRHLKPKPRSTLAAGRGDPSPPPIDIQQRILDPDIAALTRRTLRRVVTEGTGRKAKSNLYTIFGKTGTAQLPDPVHGGYYQDRYVSSFVGGAPMDHPVVIVGCFIQQPDKKIGHYGGLVSAPAVKTTLEKTLLYLGVPPDLPDATPQDAAAAMRVSEKTPANR